MQMFYAVTFFVSEIWMALGHMYGPSIVIVLTRLNPAKNNNDKTVRTLLNRKARLCTLPEVRLNVPFYGHINSSTLAAIIQINSIHNQSSAIPIVIHRGVFPATSRI